MSRIYFHSEHGTAEVRGAERAYLSILCGRFLVLALEPLSARWESEATNPLLALFAPDHFIRRSFGGQADFGFRLRDYLEVASGDKVLRYEDRTVSQFTVALNTALAAGSDPVRLGARLHGQCEIHCWVAGPHRAWLAGIMDRGRASNLYRADQGWESVIALLRSRTDGPVVCSYSVCDGFPNGGLVAAAGLWTPDPDPDYPEEPNWDGWYALPAAERWRLGMAALQAAPARGLELTPDDWDDYVVGDGVTGFDLRAWAVGLLPPPQGRS